MQRLSATVSGKAQKYSRVGAREFVPFDQFEELTVDNIKEACEQHFTELKESDDLVCDVLAGEQGPSCRTIGQIPDPRKSFTCVLFMQIAWETVPSSNKTPAQAFTPPADEKKIGHNLDICALRRLQLRQGQMPAKYFVSNS